MCIYCGTTKYRRIYEQHNGPIPKEENGRSYEIHHIDGNHSNNNPTNLKCVTLREHFDLHYSQKDHGACWKMSKRMKLSSLEISELASMHNKQRVENGTHPFLNGNKGSSHPRFDNAIYRFIHKQTLEIVEMTKNDLHKTYNLNNGNVYEMMNGNRKSCGGWMLLTKTE